MARGDKSTLDRIQFLAQQGVSKEDILSTLKIDSFDQAEETQWAAAQDVDGNASPLPTGSRKFTPEEVAQAESLYPPNQDEDMAPIPEPIITGGPEDDLPEIPQATPPPPSKWNAIFEAQNERSAATKENTPAYTAEDIRVEAGLMELATNDPSLYDRITFELTKRDQADPSQPSQNYAFQNEILAADDSATKQRLLQQYAININDPKVMAELDKQVRYRKARIEADPLLRMAVQGAVTQPVDPNADYNEIGTRAYSYSNWLDYLSVEEEKPVATMSTGDKLIDLARGVARGPLRAVEETVDSIADIFDSAEAYFLSRPMEAVVMENKDDPLRMIEGFFKELNSEILGDTKSAWGEVPELITAFIVGFSKYTSILKARNILQGPGIMRLVARGMLAGAGADFTTQPTEVPPAQILLKLMFPNEEDGTIAAAVEAIQHQEGDSEALMRLKNSAAGAGIGAVFDVVLAKVLVPLIKKTGMRIPGRQTKDMKAAMAGDRGRAADKIRQDVEAMTEQEKKEFIASNLVPKPKGGLIEDSTLPVPEEILEAQRTLDVMGARVEETAAQQARRAYTQPEMDTVMERIFKEVSRSVRAVVRPNGSEMTILPSGEGVAFKVLLGADKKVGWTNLDDALETAARLDPSFERVTLLKLDAKTGELVPWPKAGAWRTPEALQKLDDIVRRGGTTGENRFEFYVQFEQERLWHPTDALIHGDQPVLHSGMTGRYILPPRTQFSEDISAKAFHAVAQERVLVPMMQALLRDSFFGQPKYVQREGMHIMEWAADFGRKAGKNPSYSDIVGHFPEATTEGIKAYQGLASLADTLYRVNNTKLYRDWKGQGFWTLRNKVHPGVAFDGKVVTQKELRKLGKTAYDPHTQTEVLLDKKTVTDLYARGGAVIKMPAPVARTGTSRSTLVMADPDLGWRLGALRTNPLEYIPGYFPRIYKDKFFVKRIVSEGTIDGIKKPIEETIAVSPTMKAAREKVRLLAEKDVDGATYHVQDDRAMLDVDRTAADLEAMRVEGRLVFDDRSERIVKSVYGDDAEILNPVEAFQRAIWATARMVSHDDLIRTMKTRFEKTYGSLLDFKLTQRGSLEVAERLAKLGTSNDKAIRKLSKEAKSYWDYIRLMEGSVGGDAATIRGKFVDIADWVDMALPLGKVGRAGAEFVHWAARKAKPITAMKRLAFVDFIVTRPSRQLLLQSAQHLFIAPLAPRYWSSGKWVRDTIYMGRAIHPYIRKGEADLSAKVFKDGAESLGVSVKEYQMIVERLHKSGLLQTIDAHVFGGGVKNERVFNIPKTVTGDVVSMAKEGFTSIEDQLRKGFDYGEAFNIRASYMMALRKFRERSGKTISQMTDAEWDSLAVTASDLGMGMHKANTSKYQQGLLSLPSQFLSFTHKTWVSMLGGNPSIKGFDNIMKLWVGQYILFGTSMFGLREEISGYLAENGVLGIDGKGELEELMLGGAVDYVLDNSFNLAFGEGSDMPWGDFLSPTGGLAWIAKKAAESAMEQSLYEVFLGPSLATTSRIWRGASLAGSFFHSSATPEDKAKVMVNEIAKGMFSGYSDIAKATIAYNVGQWEDAYGASLGETTPFQAVAKALLGLTPDEVTEKYTYARLMKDKEGEIKRTASDLHRDMLQIASAYWNGDTTYEQALERSTIIASVLEAYPEDERYALGMAILRMEKEMPQDKSVSAMITSALMAGMPGSKENWLYQINHSHASEEDKAAMRKFVDTATASRDEAGDKLQQRLEKDSRRPQ